ncbi:MAG: thiopurine S-methyltransferase [Pseudomonadota bacterium]
MNHDYWLSKWEHAQIGFHEPAVNGWLARFGPGLMLKPGRVFVPLCGKALDLHWLAGRGHDVVGIELSELAVQQFFAEAGLNPDVAAAGKLKRYVSGRITLYAGDFFALTPAELGAVDYVYDRAALIALPAATRPQYVAHLAALLGDARGLLIALDYDQSGMQGPPFSVPADELGRLLGGYAGLRLLARDDDALDSNEKFRARGLRSLRESAYETLWTP